jgi:hypothetical protein
VAVEKHKAKTFVTTAGTVGEVLVAPGQGLGDFVAPAVDSFPRPA